MAWISMVVSTQRGGIMGDKKTIYMLTISLLLFWGTTGPVNDARADGVDHSLYGDLLQKYVKNGVVNYQGFKDEEPKLDRYLRVLEKTDTGTLSRNEQFAFYINAYNAWTIKLILGDYPGIKSIKDFWRPWKKKICRIDGDVISLDDIEHNILRPRFKDPRIHFAVNCASRDCPSLRSDPYRGDELDQQLEEMTRAFLNDPERNRIEGETLYVSRIFKWFPGDFSNDVVAFFLKYAKPDLKAQIKAKRKDIRVKYLDYDWSLNGK